MRRYLVVANRTLGGEHLMEVVRRCLAEAACSFHVVVPAEEPADHTFTDGEAQAAAEERLKQALERFRKLGAETDGEVGDHRPLDAIADALNRESYDEIIISTLPVRLSRWLKVDLPQRARERFQLPVTHVMAAE
jgi:nucleotide-binding universal stress UspA family protein